MKKIMRFIKNKTTINFLGIKRRRVALLLSAIMISVSLGSIITRGLDFGIDFTGGVLLEIGYPGPADLPKIRSLLADDGFDDVQVQSFGSEEEVLLRLPPQSDQDPNYIRDRLRELWQQMNLKSFSEESSLLGHRLVKILQSRAV